MTGFTLVIGTYFGGIMGYSLAWSENQSACLKPIFSVSCHTGCVKTSAAEDSLLLTGSFDETIRVFNLKKRKDVGIISDQHASIVSLEILKTPSSLYVFSGAEDGSFNLWKGSDWSKLFSFKGHTASILSIAVHYSGRTALTVAGSPENSLRLWDLMRGTCAMSQRFPSAPLCVLWSPGQFLYGILFAKKLLIRHAVRDNLMTEINISLEPAAYFTTFTFLSDVDVIIGDTKSRVWGFRLTYLNCSLDNTENEMTFSQIFQCDITRNLNDSTDHCTTTGSTGRVKSLCSLTAAYQKNVDNNNNNLIWFASATSTGIITVWFFNTAHMTELVSTSPSVSCQVDANTQLTTMCFNHKQISTDFEQLQVLLSDVKSDSGRTQHSTHQQLSREKLLYERKKESPTHRVCSVGTKKNKKIMIKQINKSVTKTKPVRLSSTKQQVKISKRKSQSKSKHYN